MLSIHEFVDQQKLFGHRIHEHDGIYWEEIYPFYCKPAFPFTQFNPGDARPSAFRSLLGYSHHVNNFEDGNRWSPFMVLDRSRLDSFSLLQLPSKKRNQVRRALEHCLIKPILDIEFHLERIREINVSQSLRQEHGAGAETPVRRYIYEADKWREQVRREFLLSGREWLGAFVDGVLVAYLRTYQVEKIKVIQQTKVDTAYFKFLPMDALYYTVLLYTAADNNCQRIVNGDPKHVSLNHFKEQFLFSAVEYPVYSSNAWVVETAKNLFFQRSRPFSFLSNLKVLK